MAAKICENGTPAGALVNGVDVVTFNGATARNGIDFVTALATESVTVNPTVPTTAAEAMPDTVPLELSSVMPVGKEPELTVQLYGGLPPVADSTCE